jgi:hypothetical protein
MLNPALSEECKLIKFSHITFPWQLETIFLALTQPFTNFQSHNFFFQQNIKKIMNENSKYNPWKLLHQKLSYMVVI